WRTTARRSPGYTCAAPGPTRGARSAARRGITRRTPSFPMHGGAGEGATRRHDDKVTRVRGSGIRVRILISSLFDPRFSILGSGLFVLCSLFWWFGGFRFCGSGSFVLCSLFSVLCSGGSAVFGSSGGSNGQPTSCLYQRRAAAARGGQDLGVRLG